jgi:hypothetical protein
VKETTILADETDNQGGHGNQTREDQPGILFHPE